MKKFIIFYLCVVFEKLLFLSYNRVVNKEVYIYMVTKKVEKLLNEQINKELFSAYLYLDMANFYADKNLDGFANWFTVQAKEEVSHAQIFMDYMKEIGVKIVLEAIDKPQIEFKDLKAPLVEALKHEEYVTASIHNLMEAAIEEKDYRTKMILDWFVKEQIEEEANADELINHFDMIGSKGIYMMNKDLLTRVFVEPDFTI